ncbi:type II secretion system protein N [Vibrio cincinnatiensis]|uniref:type II secretion system protein N n=1 Tax=Vibrio cincinnatiensis TaxID=675 RepID=UPI0012ACC90D|nr:type II secretion system protein N [Vibrio cincinnatiensis]MCG3725825.1 type II secretion system protein N [Vibrio cincinnatiensis]MCG3747220.1 type II secretion system protein N [Vibrio cincinnatiensis]MCG3767380.1 type II secretion system protein N [Vibrio cincinnatiensis]
MKPIVGYISLFILVMLVSAVVHLPAQIALSHLPLPSHLSVQGVSGTVWNGSAKQVHWQQKNWGEVKWQWEGAALLKAKAQLHVRFGRGSDQNVQGKGVVGYDFSGPFVQNMVVSLPIKQVQPYLTLPVPVTLQGQIELTLRDYRYQSPWCVQGEGVLAWTESEIGTPLGALALGPVMADISCQENVLKIHGSQQNTQMSSEFSAKIQDDHRFSAQAWFKPGVDFPTSLEQQLKYLPTPDGLGRYSFTRQGRF